MFNFIFTADKASKKPLYEQLYSYVADEIKNKNIKENEFCVDKLNLNLKVNSLNKEDTVDNIINQNLINIGVVV